MRTYEDTEDIVFTSNKRPALLCRDVVNDSVLSAPMVEGEESGSEEKCISVFGIDHDEDEDVAPASFMEDDDEECTGDDPELAFKRKKFHVPPRRSGLCLCFKFWII
jgi:hypothetical protein